MLVHILGQVGPGFNAILIHFNLGRSDNVDGLNEHVDRNKLGLVIHGSGVGHILHEQGLAGIVPNTYFARVC